jgi:hypothetical protein
VNRIHYPLLTVTPWGYELTSKMLAFQKVSSASLFETRNMEYTSKKGRFLAKIKVRKIGCNRARAVE